MNSTITCHGFSFTLQGDGFARANAHGDFDRIVSRVERYLDRRTAKFVGYLHAGSAINSDTDECNDVSANERLLHIVNRESIAVMATWHNPNGAFVTISAA